MIKLGIPMLLIVMDGLGDRPCRDLGGLTPLQAAYRPNMNSLAGRGLSGLMYSVSQGMTTGSDTSHLSLLGYDPVRFYSGRGPFEAMGLGLRLSGGDLAFRANFATADSNGIVKDRRAGRLDEDASELAEDLCMEMDGLVFQVKAGVEHRAALVVKGEGLSDHISDTDPHISGEKVKEVRALDSEALFTAEVLNKYLSEVRSILNGHPFNSRRREKGKLPANELLLRGAGLTPRLQPFSEKYGLSGSCIAGIPMVKGICALLGMNVVEVEGATGTVNSNFRNKIDAAVREMKKSSFVIVNIKGTDAAGHDGDAVLKKKVIERFDAALRPIMDMEATVCITGDHSTPCDFREHSGDPLPILISSPGSRRDTSQFFDEISCMKGSLRLGSGDVLQYMRQLSGNDEKYGA